jgi:hypothetical protein
MLPTHEQARICAVRRRSGWGPRLIAGENGHAHATVWRALRRAELSRLPRAPREQARRYERPCPGDLLHIDSKRFSRPGHAVTGIRDRSGAEKRMRIGHEFVHSIVVTLEKTCTVPPARAQGAVREANVEGANACQDGLWGGAGV